MLPQPDRSEGRSAASRGAVDLRLRSGGPLTVIGETPDAWLIESTVRLLPGSAVEIVIMADGQPIALVARITRCEVAAIDRAAGIRYRARLAPALGSPDTGANRLGNLLHAGKLQDGSESRATEVPP
jgi:hypothetical protein